MDYIGKIISKTQGQPTQTSASGVWTLDEAAAAVKNNSWPIPGVPNPISKSLRFNSADSAYLNRTPGSAGNRKTWTWSGWVKRTGPGSPSNAVIPMFGAVSAANDSGFFVIGVLENIISIQTWNTVFRRTTAVYRDYSAWYHVVVAFDTTQATAANRLKLYVNGVEVTAFSTSNDPTQNTDYPINNNIAHTMFSDTTVGSSYLSAYLTEVNFIDGQALTPSSFGQTNANTGVWEPKPYTGTYGGNGFYLNFKDSATTTALGYDYSGNGNNWTPNNFSVTAGAGNDSLVDVPTQWIGYNTSGDTGGIWRGNYATWNPLDKNSNGSLVNGNLDNSNSSQNNANVRSTFALPLSGKWYAELRVNSATSGTVALSFGFATSTADLTDSVDKAGKYSIYGSSSGYIFSQTSTITSGLGAFSSGDTLQIAYDGATGKAWLGKNNTWYNSTGGTTGDPGAGTNQTFTLSGEFFIYSYYYNVSGSLNCGQRPFAYTPPAGFVSLCTTNLPTPTIGATSTTQANDYFNAVLYTGTGSSLSVTGVGFQPDFVWIKGRSGATDHGLYDAVRGVQKQLESNNTNAETTETTGLTAFGTDGFTVGALAQLNTNTATYVGWNWKANGAGSSNTAGSISSTVSANTVAGFSIVTYTGTGANATVGHGCLVNGVATAPRFIICKERNTAGYDWRCYHASLGATQYIDLNSNAAAATASTIWQDTAPTTTVFSVGTNGSVNVNTGAFVAYCFAAVASYSSFGSYTGNGSTDGPMVFTGFRPRYVLIKRTDGANDWVVHDTARDTYNVADKTLYPNLSDAEFVVARLDILSNGFKLRSTSVTTNASSGTYVYAAFAESPFKYSLAR